VGVSDRILHYPLPFILGFRRVLELTVRVLVLLSVDSLLPFKPWIWQQLLKFPWNDYPIIRGEIIRVDRRRLHRLRTGFFLDYLEGSVLVCRPVFIWVRQPVVEVAQTWMPDLRRSCSLK